MTEKKEVSKADQSEEMPQDMAGAFLFGLLIGAGGVAAYFLWFQDYKVDASLISEAFFWIALTAVSIGVVLLIKEEFQAALNDYISKGLKIAIILGLVVTGFFFAGAEPINRLSLSTAELAIAAGVAFLLGIFIWKIHAVPIYGQFGYVVVLSSGIGLTWFARLSGGSQTQVIAAGFLIGGLFYFGHAFLKKGALDHT